MVNFELAPGELPATGFIRQKQLITIIPFAAATLWRKVAAKQFPAPVKLSAGVTAWHVDDVRAWLEGVTGGRPVDTRPGLDPSQGIKTTAAPSLRTQGAGTATRHAGQARTKARPARPSVSQQKLEKQLLAEANAWRQAETIRAYVAHVAGAIGYGRAPKGSKGAAWLIWATAVADRLDPTGSTPGPAWPVFGDDPSQW